MDHIFSMIAVVPKLEDGQMKHLMEGLVPECLTAMANEGTTGSGRGT